MILIVDDHPDGATALCRLLERAGYRCSVATSGHEALSKIRAHPPEQPLLIVLDDMMPDLDGISVLRLIRSEPAIAGRPVIFYSAGFDVEKREEALILGALGWFLKGGTGTMDVNMVLRRISEIYQHVGGATLRE